jgi:hypothetical protein
MCLRRKQPSHRRSQTNPPLGREVSSAAALGISRGSGMHPISARFLCFEQECGNAQGLPRSCGHGRGFSTTTGLPCFDSLGYFTNLTAQWGASPR